VLHGVPSVSTTWCLNMSAAQVVRYMPVHMTIDICGRLTLVWFVVAFRHVPSSEAQ